MWQRVAEDYAAFDVDVTTQDPGDAADRPHQRRRPGLRHPGGHLGQHHRRLGGLSDAGVAASPTSASSTTSVGDVRARLPPAGLGLRAHARQQRHQGHRRGGQPRGRPQLRPQPRRDEVARQVAATVSYYSGHALWAPIMGVGYQKPVVQWSKGEYTNANNTAGRPDGHRERRRPGDRRRGRRHCRDRRGRAPGPGVHHLGRRHRHLRARDVCGAADGQRRPGAPPSQDLDIKLELLDAAGSVVAHRRPGLGRRQPGLADRPERLRHRQRWPPAPTTRGSTASGTAPEPRATPTTPASVPTRSPCPAATGRRHRRAGRPGRDHQRRRYLRDGHLDRTRLGRRQLGHGYTASRSGARRADPGSRHEDLGRADAGRDYLFSVAATNAIGTGVAASQSRPCRRARHAHRAEPRVVHRRQDLRHCDLDRSSHRRRLADHRLHGRPRGRPPTPPRPGPSFTMAGLTPGTAYGSLSAPATPIGSRPAATLSATTHAVPEAPVAPSVHEGQEGRDQDGHGRLDGAGEPAGAARSPGTRC